MNDMDMKSPKSAVLAKCEDLAPAIYGNYPFEGKTIERTATESRIYADWGVVRFSSMIPEDDEVWSIAAQILGIEDEQDAKDRELVAQSLLGCSEGVIHFADHLGTKNVYAAIKRLAGMEVQNG